MQPHVRRFVERAVTFQECPECEGTRLTADVLRSKIGGKSIADLCAMQISDLADWVRELEEPSVAPLLKGLQHLLDSFTEIGLGYLSLDRPAGTLSGGEAQRTKMIRHLGSSLTDVTYVFDEPTIGLHPHDIARMNDLLHPAARQGQHRPRRRAQARDDRHRRPRRRPRPGGRLRRRRDRLRGLRRGAAARPAPSPDATSTTAPGSSPRCAPPTGTLEVRGAVDPQPARRRRRHPARRARRRDRRRRVGQELAHPRLRRRARRRRRRRPGRDQGLASQQPRDLHRACSSRSARRSPRPTASSRPSSAPTPRAPARPATAPG